MYIAGKNKTDEIQSLQFNNIGYLINISFKCYFWKSCIFRICKEIN